MLSHSHRLPQRSTHTHIRPQTPPTKVSCKSLCSTGVRHESENSLIKASSVSNLMPLTDDNTDLSLPDSMWRRSERVSWRSTIWDKHCHSASLLLPAFVCAAGSDHWEEFWMKTPHHLNPRDVFYCWQATEKYEFNHFLRCISQRYGGLMFYADLWDWDKMFQHYRPHNRSVITNWELTLYLHFGQVSESIPIHQIEYSVGMADSTTKKNSI